MRFLDPPAPSGLRASTVGKLFGVGLTVGPVVDSLHNQCLLQYDYAPFDIPFPQVLVHSNELPVADHGPLLATSWVVPPLLGIAYVVLGGAFPRLCQFVINTASSPFSKDGDSMTQSPKAPQNLQFRAITAVLTTAVIIKLSEFLETHPTAMDSFVPLQDIAIQHIVVLLLAALCQWALLDGTAAALLTASIASVGGPLSELPFVAGGFWHYLPAAGDYLPLEGINVDSALGQLLTPLLGRDFPTLALSSITGPCYFAVTMDAIALGKWFDAQEEGR